MINRIVMMLAIPIFSTALPQQAESAPNILLIIGDDMGVETLAAYGVGRNFAVTPTLDQMARDGMRFNNFWSQPVCSPTRATIITGRYGFRTGIGRPVGTGPAMPNPPAKPEWASFEPQRGGGGQRAAEQALPRPYLLPDEVTLPKPLQANGYATAAIGKWHLADEANGWLSHPNLVGFEHYSGLIGGFPESYFAWNKVTDGVVTGRTGYTPADKVDDAIAWIGKQQDRPWFLWFAFNLPHTPLHLPPREVWRSDHANLDAHAVPEAESRSYFRAMIEAMDSQIERLLASLDAETRENTFVIFLGDNGTESGHVDVPFQRGRAKGTIYEGGVNVPLIVTGPGVEHGGASDVLVNSSDLFDTIMEMAGLDPDNLIPDYVKTDSISFFYALSDSGTESRRKWLYADEFFGGFAGVEDADYAVRNSRYKFLRFEGAEEFYDLQEDPYEHHNLLNGNLSAEERVQHADLKRIALELRESQ